MRPVLAYEHLNFDLRGSSVNNYPEYEEVGNVNKNINSEGDIAANDNDSTYYETFSAAAPITIAAGQVLYCIFSLIIFSLSSYVFDPLISSIK